MFSIFHNAFLEKPNRSTLSKVITADKKKIWVEGDLKKEVVKKLGEEVGQFFLSCP